MKIKAKQTRTKMSPQELETYMNEVRKSAHTFENKKRYNRKKLKKGCCIYNAKIYDN